MPTLNINNDVVLFPSANVGIGTTSPTSKLNVQGTAAELQVKNDATNSLVLGGWDGTRHYIKSINLGVALTPLTLQASAFTFDTGNVLIGTTTDAGYKLSVNGSLSTTYANVYDPTSWSVVNIAASSVGVSASTHYSPYGTVSGTNPVFCTGQKFSEHGNYSIWRYNGSSHLATDFAINNSGAATFSSSVTASSLIKSGGTSSQYLMADGSVSTTATINNYTQTFFVPDTSGTAQWVKLGTWTAGQGGNVVTVQIDQHAGYNATTGQNQQVYIYMKTSNGSSVDANGFAGDSSFWTEGINQAIQSGDVIWEANAAGVGATSYTLYVNMGAYTNASQYTVTTRGGTWTNVGTLTSPSGTTPSSTILLSENRFVVNNILTVGGAPSGNVLIGTYTDGGYKLDVSGITRANAFYAVNDRNQFARGFARLTSSSNNTSTLDIDVADTVTSIYSNYYGGGADQPIRIGTYANFTNQLYLATSGVVGIGTVPNANWGTGNNYSATQFRNASLYYRNFTAELYIGNNSYYDGSNWRYMSTAAAAMLELGSDNFEFFSAASGTSGNSFTWGSKMKIVGGTGNVLIGTTADAGYKLRVVGSTYTTGDVVVAKTTTANADFGGPVLSLGDSTSEVGMCGGIAFTENLTSAVEDVTMGIYYDGKANKMHFTGSSDAQATAGENLVAATKHMTITRDSGLVGIGTTAPVSTNLVGSLTVYKSYNGDTASVPSITAQTYYENQSGLYLFGRNSGLTIVGANGENNEIVFANASSKAYAKIGTSNGTTSAGGDMYFNTGGNAEAMRITTSGNVGINTTSPSDFLHIRTGIGWGARITYTGDNSYLRFSSNQIAAFNSSNNGTDLYFNHNAAGNILFSGTGNVGIGTTSPDTPLSTARGIVINSGASNDVQIRMQNNGTGSAGSDGGLLSISGSQMYLWNYEASNLIFGTNNSERMRIDSSGNIGIGTTSISYRVDISGDARILSGSLGVGVAPNATDGRIDASNDIVAYQTSDQRLKENVTPIENALEKVKSLTGVEFDWIEEHKHIHGYEGHDTGIIAQQVQAVMPTAVRTNDTGYLSVRYEKLIGLLIEANKELAARVEELESKLK